MLLAVENAITGSDVAARVAQQTLLRRRGADYADEVRRLLDAALEVMRRSGTGGKARVADIVAAAGLSNEAFYRHFPSKEALVTAVLDDGTARLRSYLVHQMGKQRTPDARIRRWVEGVLAQADGETGATTLAVLCNAGGGATGPPGAYPAQQPLSDLLVEPLTALGSRRPELDAALFGHAVVGLLRDHLWARTHPTKAEADHVVAACLRAVA
jgi:AcrR family transcriptional regulator